MATTAAQGSLRDMLSLLPDLPLAQSDAMIIYANLAAQAAATGVAPTSSSAPYQDQQYWISVLLDIYLPETTKYWFRDGWAEGMGFDVYQVEQAIEYAAPPRRLTVVRGTFDLDTMRAAWATSGFKPIDLGVGAEAYAIREDFAFDRSDPISSMVLAAMNVVALTENGVFIAGSDRASVAAALAAAAGTAPSLVERPDVAPLAETAPEELASALLFPGTMLQYAPDVSSVLLEGETPETMATRVAAEQSEAQRMPPIGSLMLGLTPGNTPNLPGDSPAEAVVAVSVGSASAAEQGATVVRERLDTQSVPMTVRSGYMGRSWAELFPLRTVTAVPEAGVVFVELTPGPDMRLLSLPFLVYTRGLTFMAW